MKKPIWVIGLGLGDSQTLSPQVSAIIQHAEVLIGSQRLLVPWESHSAEKIPIGHNLEKIIARLQARIDEEIVVLASGDPGFHGIAGTLLEHFSPDEIRIVPNISSLQAAFAKAGLTWNDAVFASVHAHPLSEIVGWAKRVPKLGILTDHKRTPAAIAAHLLQAGVPDCRAIVAENLGMSDELITDTRLCALADKTFAPLNVLLLIHDDGWRPASQFCPRPESAYAHRHGLITKADVRTLSLSRLAITETDTVWDIGAGSGAVSIEMAEISWRGRVFAVERDSENLGYIRENIARYGVLNIEVIDGTAPEILHKLPLPNAVFIGGTGGRMQGILEYTKMKALPGCRVVINLATIENLNQAIELMKSLGWSPEVTQVSTAHSRDIAGYTRLSPINPVFIVSGTIR